jgi:hypothetical protein
MALHDRKRPRIAAVVEPIAPSAPGDGALDAEKVAVRRGDGRASLLGSASPDIGGAAVAIRNYSRGIDPRRVARGVIHCRST